MGVLGGAFRFFKGSWVSKLGVGVLTVVVCVRALAFAEPLRSPAIAPFSKESFSLDLKFPEPRLVAQGMGARVEMAGAQVLHTETLPEIPYFEFPASDAAQSLTWDRLEAGEVPGADLESAAETYLWTHDPAAEFRAPTAGRFFPGFLARMRGRFLQVFPVQWDRARRALVVVRSVRVQGWQRATAPAASAGVVAPTATSLILVPAHLETAAELLRDFHRQEYGVVSQIVRVETLAHEPEIAEAQLPDGYKDRAAADLAVRAWDPQTGEGYPYSTARRIAHYLQARIGPAGVRYVTLVGGGAEIPPSYYFAVRMGFGAKFVASDQCYAATDLCFSPKAAVGRLPFATVDEMRTYLTKVRDFRRQAGSASEELALLGGKAFGGPFYIGELGALRALGPAADWFSVSKKFRTLGNYDRDAVLRHLTGAAGTPLVYSLDHGFGNQWMVERQKISSEEIARLPATGGISPVVFSVSCSNGAFDEAYALDDLFPDRSQGPQSVGVTLLRSAAGAVAYLGSTRLAAGEPVFKVDSRGNLDLTDSTYGLRVLDTVLEKYRAQGQGRLGDLIRETLGDYLAQAATQIAPDRSHWTYFNFAFLGDPLFEMPVRQRRSTALDIATAVQDIENPFRGYYPSLAWDISGWVTRALTLPVEVRATVFSQSLQSGLVEESVVHASDLPAGAYDLRWEDAQGKQTFFVRLENKVGLPRERQLWFRTR